MNVARIYQPPEIAPSIVPPYIPCGISLDPRTPALAAALSARYAAADRVPA
jgi:hypothetical protein